MGTDYDGAAARSKRSTWSVIAPKLKPQAGALAILAMIQCDSPNFSPSSPYGQYCFFRTLRTTSSKLASGSSLMADLAQWAA